MLKRAAAERSVEATPGTSFRVIVGLSARVRIYLARESVYVKEQAK
jgi:hypothetical protein